jgi:(2R)-3-sulfolactate dehydrogenase (NADP+)
LTDETSPADEPEEKPIMPLDQITLTPKAARALIFDALTGAGTTPDNARTLTEGVLDTELSGMAGHGFDWLPSYCRHLKSGKVNGKAKPSVKRVSAVSFRVDAKNGFAHPAIEAGFAKLVPAARSFGIAGMAVTRSYNAGTLGFHTATLARQGLLAIGFTNSSARIAPVGGRTPVLGTNPMSFAVPGKAGIAFLIDQSSSAVAWSTVRQAADEGREIPLGWALDKEGKPTTDPKKGLEGTMAPSGGYKGFCWGLIVEVMCAALAGANRGPQMGSFTLDDGKHIGCGQFFIAIAPDKFSGGMFASQVAALARSITSQPGARLPNAKRQANRKRLKKEGLPIDRALYEKLKSLAA